MNGILSKKHIEAGISLEEDDHTIMLKQRGEIKAVFSIHATLESIIHEADQMVEWSKSGISFDRREK
jgi:hypothetical protein